MAREPRAVLLLLSLAALGHLTRLLLQDRKLPPGQILAEAPPGADPAGQRARAERLARPLGPEERIDLNSAPAEQIARLPRIGMSLAKRMVDDRAGRGPFQRLEDLDRVPGVGPALLASLAERVSFGPGPPGPSGPVRGANPGTSGAYGASRPVPEGSIELNSASLADLVALPGIGKARARAILAYRRSHGSFAAVSDLERVPGFSRSLVAGLMPYLTVR
jgi:competence ComEA-like helix-hairpin-helix protein